MASSYISFSNGTVSSLVNQTITNWYMLKRLNAEMDSLLGSPAVFANLETPFGLAAGTGEAFYNTLVGLRAAMDSACPALANLDKLG